MFYHHTGRALPVIVDGPQNRLALDPLAKSLGVRFYAAAPFESPGGLCGGCLGVVAIIKQKPIDMFGLADESFLTSKAAEVTSVVKAHVLSSILQQGTAGESGDVTSETSTDAEILSFGRCALQNRWALPIAK
eukprot:TRINITY_DN27431_c0_g2_i1.p2 TRINITY_DN27431_c0_g2~~TRINITY_DN27431_c0_g2_i1.p2  ORF type:complete len:133 (-),score=31.33 TRINITY_DN27431_c0_g2_i1:127-525(-)